MAIQSELSDKIFQAKLHGVDAGKLESQLDEVSELLQEDSSEHSDSNQDELMEQQLKKIGWL